MAGEANGAKEDLIELLNEQRLLELLDEQRLHEKIEERRIFFIIMIITKSARSGTETCSTRIIGARLTSRVC